MNLRKQIERLSENMYSNLQLVNMVELRGAYCLVAFIFVNHGLNHNYSIVIISLNHCLKIFDFVVTTYLIILLLRGE